MHPLSTRDGESVLSGLRRVEGAEAVAAADLRDVRRLVAAGEEASREVARLRSLSIAALPRSARPRCSGSRETDSRRAAHRAIALSMQKQSVWVIWIGSILAMVLGSGWIATVGQVLFGLTFIAHVVEFFMKRPLFEQVGGSMGHHFVQTMIYGLFHWKPLEEQQAGD